MTLQSPKLLLVDDEEPFVTAMTKRLTRRGYPVAEAFDGRAALDVLKNNPGIDVVVLDVKMPGMDGTATLHEIRRQFPLVEVIMLTGHATVESAIDGMKKGAFDYLMKPCEIETLIAKVEEAAARKRSQEDRIQQASIKEITSRRV